jgi:hypothetical protein
VVESPQQDVSNYTLILEHPQSLVSRKHPIDTVPGSQHRFDLWSLWLFVKHLLSARRSQFVTCLQPHSED